MLFCIAAATGCRASIPVSGDGAAQARSAPPSSQRSFEPVVAGRWIGNGVCYGPYRDGQSPDSGINPSEQELRADLELLAPRWGMLRMYGSRGPAETVVRLIHELRLPLKVMIGAWVATETRTGENGELIERFPETVAANRAEVETAIRLANAYPQVVMAINVGNETQVSWSFHKVQPQVLIRFIRDVRRRTHVPVTTADDFSYWLTPESRVVASEVDFIVMHAYAMWWGRAREQALRFTQENYAAACAMHPGITVVIGETGWATARHTEGEEARLMAGVANEAQQAAFLADYLAWTTSQRVANFYFEAFDENWKGGEHPDAVEKHWGLFRADRSPKPALRAVPTRE